MAQEFSAKGSYFGRAETLGFAGPLQWAARRKAAKSTPIGAIGGPFPRIGPRGAPSVLSCDPPRRIMRDPAQFRVRPIIRRARPEGTEGQRSHRMLVCRQTKINHFFPAHPIVLVRQIGRLSAAIEAHIGTNSRPFSRPYSRLSAAYSSRISAHISRS